MCELRKVDDRKRGLLAVAAALALRYEIIDDDLAYVERSHRGVAAELRQPVGVVPADTGLRLLRSDQVVRVGVKHEGRLRRCHQARIEADEIELHAAVAERLVDARERHGASRIFLIITVAAHRSAAVIPEDQLIAVGRERFYAVLNKAGERRGRRHCAVARIVLEAGQASALHLIDLVHRAAYGARLPLRAAAGEHDDVHVAAEVGCRHLLQIVCSHAVLRLKVGTAHVHEDRDLVLAVALDRRVFCAGTLRHLIVDVARFHCHVIAFLRRLLRFRRGTAELAADDHVEHDTDDRDQTDAARTGHNVTAARRTARVAE